MEVVFVNNEEAVGINKNPGWYVRDGGVFVYGPASRGECESFVSAEREKYYSPSGLSPF